MKTEKTQVDGTMYVFAEAKSSYELEKLDYGELPFRYKIKSYDHGDEASVRLMEHPVAIVVPEGIDITLECISNLKEKIVSLEKDCASAVASLNKRIKALALIEYKPEPQPESMEGEDRW